ncbi:MAG: hypothetical protein HY287_15910 [Planctomycetes bacterium]|nr:hypothetical protein [Planctomycetota bacterium]MBI3835811.1 hypothetical protein [Planctomycetota bacterium]
MRFRFLAAVKAGSQAAWSAQPVRVRQLTITACCPDALPYYSTDTKCYTDEQTASDAALLRNACPGFNDTQLQASINLINTNRLNGIPYADAQTEAVAECQSGACNGNAQCQASCVNCGSIVVNYIYTH